MYFQIVVDVAFFPFLTRHIVMEQNMNVSTEKALGLNSASLRFLLRIAGKKRKQKPPFQSSVHHGMFFSTFN